MPDRWQSLADTLRGPETLVVNLYGGPGTGKSTTAAMVFSMLKQEGYTAELVTEYAKDLVWEGRSQTLDDQVYILGKQNHRIHRLLGQVDVVVTDAPIMLSHYYARSLPVHQHGAVCYLSSVLHNDTRSLNFFIVRDNIKHPYNPRGRYQDLTGAEQVDRDVKEFLSPHIRFIDVPVGDGCAEYIVSKIKDELA